ncbi:FAD/FMN-containing dehydrogenase [Motilibacter peucedani]|uniref:FAD/FMN-containing dehydrogenase n=1 Tax=Motilibacter peucedani TaxID=598650 RepID=A0A420XMC4_9ACTN|nr:FAD-binding protein [Motilibacter peucedani]RKS71410.1 FAD/FMN-containing dehydrogenase [Motilibacter peucedani]
MSTPVQSADVLPTTHFPTQSRHGAPSLRELCGGAVHLPGDPGYDDARQPWNVAVDQRPAAVAYPASAAEVSEVVRAAAAAGLRVAVQGTGHNAGPLGDLRDAVLLRTSAMIGVRVDAARRRVTVGAGTLWLEAVEAAAQHGLAVLHGSSPDVGVVGYCLGGGMGWYARKLGFAAHSITGAELVLADGSVVRVSPEENPDLLWGLRGGGGNIGIVTELEIEAFDFTTAYAGMLVWDWERAAEVLPVWAAWAREVDESVTTSFRLLQLPPLPVIPEPFRGRNLVVIDGAVMGDTPAVSALLAPLRALHPELDTFAHVPVETLTRLHMDPEGPTPGVSNTVLLSELTPEGIETFLRVAGPGSGSPLLAAEIRQLGGAVSRPAPYKAALSHLEGDFLVFGVGIAATPEMGAAVAAGAAALVEALSPWASRQCYLNFVEHATDTSTGYAAGSWHRLQRLRREVDPQGLLRANHGVPVAE